MRQMDGGKTVVTEEDIDNGKRDLIAIEEEYEKVKGDIFGSLQFRNYFCRRRPKTTCTTGN